MRIVNRTYKLPREVVVALGGVPQAVADAAGAEPLRWFVSAADRRSIRVEVTEVDGLAEAPARTVPSPPPTGRSVVISLIPTGIGCALGGFAGDAAPVTSLLGAAADLVVTHPNAVNASNFILADDATVYCEGYSLNLFATGATQLHQPRANRIGVIIEQADRTAIEEVFNVINATRAVHGLTIVGCVVTDEPIATSCVRAASGAYLGQVGRPDVLLAAGRRLVAAGATALAVTTNVGDLPREEYSRHFLGTHPNPVGGAEAIVSHLLTRTLGVPSAHAPMINFTDILPGPGVVDARAAGEYVSTSGLACVLMGLRRAPQLGPRPGLPATNTISVDDVIAVVAPATALGSPAVFAALERRTPVIAVRENRTVLDVTAGALDCDAVIEVANYLEAAGTVLALRAGIARESLVRPLATLR